ncbi:MAG: repeat protein [Nevskia sp.]|nr:repeat protein [Nevskia sp.]
MHLKCWRRGLIPMLLSASAIAAEAGLKPAVDCFNRGDYSCVQQLLLEAQRLNPENTEAAYYLGRTAHRRKDWKTAVEQLQRAVTLQPANAEYHFRFGLSLSRYIDTVGVMSKPGVALHVRENLLKAIELNPDFIDARDALLKYYLAAPAFLGGGVDKAREQAAQIAKRSVADGHIALAEIDEHQRLIEPAIAEYQAAIATGTDSSAHDARIELGQLYQHQQQFDEAFTVLQHALRKDAADRQAQYELGNTAMLCSCRIDQGIAALKDFLRNPATDDDDDASPAQAHLQLGGLYKKSQRRAEARIEYNTALQLDAQLDEARQALRALD